MWLCLSLLGGTGLVLVSRAVGCVVGAVEPVPGCPAWVCALGRQEVPGECSAHLTDLPALFSQVCNCNKYLKVSRERMRQLVEGSRRASGEHSAGEWVDAQGWA